MNYQNKFTDFIFSITTRCENEYHSELPITCVKSIRNFYPNADIVIVDSNSPNKDHIHPLKELGCIISNTNNIYYETGGIWDTFSKFDRETYVFLQDSMTLLGNIDQFLQKDFTFIGNIIPNWDGCEQYHIDWVKNNIIKSDYPFLENNFNILQYNSMIINKKILSKLKLKNLDKILPTDKIGSCGMERIFGIALTLEGYTIDINSQLAQDLIIKLWKNRQ